MYKRPIIRCLLLILLISYIFYLCIHGISRDSIIYNVIQIFSTTNNFILLLYALSFLITFIVYQKKKKAFDTGSLLYLIYVSSAFGSCWYYTQEKVDLFYANIMIAPLIFLFVTINICLYPFWNTNFQRYRKIDDGGLGEFYNYLSVSFFVLSLLPILSLLLNFSFSMLIGSSLGNMYESDIDKSALFFAGPSKVCFALIRRFEALVAVLFFYQIIKGNKKLVIALLFPVALFVLFKLLSGSRGGLVGSALQFITLYFMLRSAISKPLQKNIEKFGMICVVIFILMFAAISISRFSLNDTGEYSIDRWISQYLGESVPRFSDDVWELNKTMDGNQNFILIRKFLGLSYIENYDSFLAFYEARLGTPANVFYTFMGDIYLDFGLIGSIIFAVVFAMVFKRLLSSNSTIVSIPTLVCLSMFFSFLGFGFAANVYRVIFIQEDNMWLLIAVGVLYAIQKAKIPPTMR